MKKNTLLSYSPLAPLTMLVKSSKKIANTMNPLFPISLEENNRKITLAYENHKEALLRYCYFRVSNKEKATDLVQETFTRTWQYLMKGNYIESDTSFLYTTLRHLIIDDYRKKKHTSLDSLINTSFEPVTYQEEQIHTMIEAARIIKCVDKLPGIYSSVITMRYVNDFSVSDIARMMNTSENVVSVRIHRGISKLRLLIPS